MAITRVVGMDCDCRVAQHRLRSSCRYSKCDLGIVHERIADMVQLPLHIFMLNFDVRQSRQAARAPIDQTFSTIDQSIFIKPHKDFEHGFRESFVHGEAKTIPIAGLTKPFLLTDNGISRGGLPLPDALDETFASKGFPGKAFGHELLFHDVLRGNPGMISARKPEHIEALHPSPAYQYVL